MKEMFQQTNEFCWPVSIRIVFCLVQYSLDGDIPLAQLGSYSPGLVEKESNYSFGRGSVRRLEAELEGGHIIRISKQR